MGMRVNKKITRSALGARLRALRKARGLSQEKLGRLSHLSGKFIGECERGEKSISIDSISRVSIALDVSLPEIVTLQNGRHGVSADAEQLLAYTRVNARKLVKAKALAVLCAMLAKS